MAYTNLPSQSITRAGVTPTMTAAPATGTGNGFSFSNNGRRFLRIKNAGGSACVATLIVGATVDGQAVTSRSYTVAATTGDQFIGPFPPGDYNDGSGLVKVDFDNVTTVTCGLFELA